MEVELQFTENMIRGKRTKRPRPCSPFADSNGEHCLASTLSEEDEDMANCLILLAQSVCVSPIIKEEKTDPIRYKTEKINSRKLTDITSGNKSGSYYAYECKTCNRSFPSFQALGGHRASHKKPKLNTEEKEAESMVSLDTHDQNNDNYEKSPSPDSSPARAQIKISVHDHSKEHSNKPKVHECSICGSEFLSGQALGGHMRKHRPIQLPINRAATSSIDDDKSGDHSVFSLDLNLPPPETMEDIVVQSKFESFKSMFSSPALVDCPY